MKKIIIPLILILSLSGCKDYIEINDLAILTGIVIDYKDDMYEVTAQLIVNDKDSKIEVFKTSSSSINEAIAELSKLSNKEVFILNCDDPQIISKYLKFDDIKKQIKEDNAITLNDFNFLCEAMKLDSHTKNF